VALVPRFLQFKIKSSIGKECNILLESFLNYFFPDAVPFAPAPPPPFRSANFNEKNFSFITHQMGLFSAKFSYKENKKTN
jgi:hypothetical protein